jgi:hypothetical protein
LITGVSVIAVGGGWYRCSLTYTLNGTVTAHQMRIYPKVAGIYVGTGEGAYFWGAQLEISFTASAYQKIVSGLNGEWTPGNHASQSTATSRPVLKIDANGKYYLLFDGIDDSMSTASINFTSTDKMTVFAGVTRLTSVGFQALLEHTVNPNTTDSFSYVVSTANVMRVQAKRGAGYSFSEFTQSTTPSTFVGTGLIDLSLSVAAETIIRNNGSAGAVNGASVELSGNFANAPLYIGRRAETSFPFNGRLYSLIVRGAQSTDAQITSAETYVNSKTKAY